MPIPVCYTVTRNCASMKGLIPLKRLNRTIHLDFHTMPDIPNLGEGFDATVFARRLADAHVQSVNVFAVCNQGFAYYPTRVGIPHPYLKTDMLGDMIRECHARDIEVVAYVNYTLAHAQANLHPGWCRMDESGRILTESKRENPFARTMCYNNPEYREYLKEITREVCAYKPDGFYFDCIYPRPCWCPHCVRDMKAAGVDINSVAAVTDFTYSAIRSLAAEIREIVPRDTNIIFSGIASEHIAGSQYRSEIEHLPICWGFEDVPAAAAYQRSVYGNDRVVYMTGRFQKSWGDFGGFKGKISLENDMYDALCYGIGFCVGDHMHPAGNLDEGMYKIYGSLFEKFMAYEPWTNQAVPATEIGIIRNRFNAYTDTLAVDVMNNKLTVNACVRMLLELKHSFNVINDDMELDRYRLIILPDTTVMTDQLREKLGRFLDAGGRVISTGESGLTPDKTGFALPQWNFLTFHGLDRTDTSFYHPKVPMGEIDFDWSAYTEGIRMTARDKTTEVAAHVQPYFDRHWDGLFGYYYIPPEKETGFSTMAMTDQVCQVSFKLFTAYGKYFAPFHKDLIRYALDRYIPDPIIRAPDMPSTSHVTTADAEDFTLLHVKVTYPEHRGSLGIIEEHNVLPAGHKVSIRGSYRSLKLLPVGTEIPFEVSDGYTTVTLPQITGYAMFLCEK